MPVRVKVDLDGPFFRRDPRKTFRKNVREFMDEVAGLGEETVKGALRAGESGRQPLRAITPERVSGHVRGRTSSLTGKRWALTAVVSVDTSGRDRRQAIAIKAAAASIERRTGVFRKSTSAIRRAKTNLLKGLT